MNSLDALTKRIAKLSEGQLALLDSVAEILEQPIEMERLSDSDVVSSQFLTAFGDMLKLHHALSIDYLDKHRFEAAMERIYRALGCDASRPPRNNPGHDLTVDGVEWSLKTQGDKTIKEDELHISKFMELGKGKWGDDEEDLHGLRDMFLEHMTSYSRIFQLRYFNLSDGADSPNPVVHFYELVEIPKALLQESAHGEFEMKFDSKQTPKPGYCRVMGTNKSKKFELYFDGGSERKLQIKHLRKALCVVHANWRF